MFAKTIKGKEYQFRLPAIDQLDRYFGKISKSLVTASVVLATDMAQPDDRQELGAIFQELPGVATEVATEGLKGRGFNTESSQD